MAVLAVAVVAALAVLGWGGVAVYSLWTSYQSVSSIDTVPDPFAGLPTRPSDPTPDADGSDPGPDEGGSDPEPADEGADAEREAVNILLLGSDSRELSDPGDWSFGAQRTDTIMLLHLPADRNGAYFISVPRDSWVSIPGHGKAKINAAYSYGGFPLLVQTFEQLTGIRIDHIAITNFESFAAMTDAVGGVRITVPQDSYDRGELSFAAGTYLMSGDEALVYARQRFGLPAGDFDRIKRQQNWIRAIGQKIDDEGLLALPTTLSRLIKTLSRSVAVDAGFDRDEMTSLALSVRHLKMHNLTFLTIPVQGTGWSPDGTQSIVVLDDDGVADLSRAVASDRLKEYVKANRDDLSLLGDVVR